MANEKNRGIMLFYMAFLSLSDALTELIKCFSIGGRLAPRLSYAFTASFKDLPALNAGDLEAAMVIASPVAGLRP